MPLVTRLAGAVMCTGEAVARAHPGAAGLGERLVLFFPPVDLELFRADPAVRSRARSELGLGPDEPVVGTVGNLTPMKDHDTLVRAAAALHRMHPGTRFVILGSSYEHRSGYADEVLRTGEELGLQPGRDLIIRDPGERVAELAQAFDVFWLSSRSRSEGLPTVVGEAMALGLPVVATRVGSVPEAVDGGGLLVPPSDPEALARRGRAAHRRPLRTCRDRRGGTSLGQRAVQRRSLGRRSHSRLRDRLRPCSPAGRSRELRCRR